MEQASYELKYRNRTEEQYTDRSPEDESAEDELKDYALLGRPRVQTSVERNASEIPRSVGQPRS